MNEAVIFIEATLAVAVCGTLAIAVFVGLLKFLVIALTLAGFVQ